MLGILIRGPLDCGVSELVLYVLTQGGRGGRLITVTVSAWGNFSCQAITDSTFSGH